jgi:cytochrome c oxidase cbb3-type subunit III
MTTAEATGEVIAGPESAAVPESQPAEPQLLEHAYDGIREYDNPLPGWWRGIFWGTIVFSGFYVLYFHVVDWGRTPDEKYQAALAEWESGRNERERSDLASVSEASLAQKAADAKVTARGAEVFAMRCASCHGADGSGLIGPNLTDDRQLHGASRLDLYRVVRGGVPGTAMVAWGEQLAPADLVAATAYAIILRGKNLPGKPPEGAPVGAFAP